MCMTSGGLLSKLAWEEDYLSLVGTQTWKYNLKMLFKGIWSPRALEGALINAG